MDRKNQKLIEIQNLIRVHLFSLLSYPYSFSKFYRLSLFYLEIFNVKTQSSADTDSRAAHVRWLDVSLRMWTYQYLIEIVADKVHFVVLSYIEQFDRLLVVAAVLDLSAWISVVGLQHWNSLWNQLKTKCQTVWPKPKLGNVLSSL